MRRLLPEVDARLCDHRMEHGFVLDHSQLMADVLRDWIETHRKLSNNNNNNCGAAVDKAPSSADDVVVVTEGGGVQGAVVGSDEDKSS